MSMVATYKGKIQKGKVKLSAGVKLPEDVEVFVLVPENEPKFDLAKMVLRMPDNYVALEEGFGKPEGREIW